jgi:hypothetical protein
LEASHPEAREPLFTDKDTQSVMMVVVMAMMPVMLSMVNDDNRFQVFSMM